MMSIDFPTRFSRRFTPTASATLVALSLMAGAAYAPAYAGSGTAADPFITPGEAFKVTTSGRYWFKFGTGAAFQADVDTSNGGGWILILQYVHRGGTNPLLSIIAAGSNLPVTSTAALGADESGIPARWGHAGNAAMAAFTGNLELRWYGITSGTGGPIHFRSGEGDTYFQSNTGSFSSIGSSFTALPGHTAAGLPAAANSYYAGQGNYALTEFPYYRAGARHWGIKGLGTRWEVNDQPVGGFVNSTIHRIWVRAEAVADLNITKTNSVTSVISGTTTTYTIVVSNLGPGVASSAVVKDTPAAGLTGCTVQSCNASGGASCPSVPGDILSVGGVSIPTFPSGSSATFSVQCTVQ